jgi:acid phosphatase type 7
MQPLLRGVVLFATAFLGAAAAAATFNLSDAALPDPLVLIAYGDMRFTGTAETQASNPRVRAALVAKIAAEEPAAIFVNGDLPWHGVTEDYEVFRSETGAWRDRHLRIYPALGNHEFSQCAEPVCLERWWTAFPELRGRRWYSVALGSKVLGLVLDSDAPLLPGSEQRLWLEQQIAAMGRGVRFVLIALHHPPVADPLAGALGDHNPRPNEQSLADYLPVAARQSRARFVVIAGHIHNYERLDSEGVSYLVSGGGGAKPYEVERTPADRYQGTDFPNYHYIRFELRGETLRGEMIRLGDSEAAHPGQWEVRDRFELSPPP